MGVFARGPFPKGMWSKKKKRSKKRKSSAGKCARVRICGKARIVCRNRKGQIKSNRPAGKKRR